MIILGFWSVLYLALGRKREEKDEGLQIDLFVAMWRTKRLLGFIDSIANKYRQFWRVYATLAIFVGYAGMLFVFYMLIKSALIAVKAKAQVAGVQLVIPGVTIPLWYGIIGLIVVMFVHELSHGLVARAENLPLKSVGLLLFVVIPGAFVEPDEENLKKAPLISRLRVYAAGSMANLLTAFIAMLLLGFVLTPVLQYSGVEVAKLDTVGPARDYLKVGDVIVGIDGEKIATVEDFLSFMNKTHAGQVVTLEVIREGKRILLDVPLGDNPDKPRKGYLGVYPTQNLKSKIGLDSIVLPIAFSLYWVYVLNFGIGLMNLFPLIPLDGGRMLDDVFKEYLPQKLARALTFTFIGVGVLLLAINLIPALRGLIG